MKVSEIIDDKTTSGKVITLIGKILTPTGLIVIFCNILSLSNLDTGIVSLITMILTLILLFYNPLSRLVPSPIILIVLLLLSSVFYFSYQNILIKDTGLIEYFKETKEIDSYILKKIKKENTEIWFFGTNFHRTSFEFQSNIANRLDNGVSIKYLVLNPFSPIFKYAAEDFGQSEFDLYKESIIGLKNYLSLINKSKSMKHPGSLEIKFYNSIPRFRAYVFDPKNPKNSSFFTPYIHSINSPEIPCFHFTNSPERLFGIYFNNIQNLWFSKSSISYETFYLEHKNLIDSIKLANQFN